MQRNPLEAHISSVGEGSRAKAMNTVQTSGGGGGGGGGMGKKATQFEVTVRCVCLCVLAVTPTGQRIFKDDLWLMICMCVRWRRSDTVFGRSFGQVHTVLQDAAALVQTLFKLTTVYSQGVVLWAWIWLWNQSPEGAGAQHVLFEVAIHQCLRSVFINLFTLSRCYVLFTSDIFTIYRIINICALCRTLKHTVW